MNHSPRHSAATRTSPPIAFASRWVQVLYTVLGMAVCAGTSTVGAADAARAATGVARPSGDDTLAALSGDYRYCTTCHGAQLAGNTAIQAPALAGIDDWFLAARLRDYREQRLGHDFRTDPAGTEMRIVARELGDERIAAIQRFVAAFAPSPSPPAATVAGNAASGRRLYASQCASCHGRGAEGNAQLHAPALRHLNDWYVVTTWTRYRDGLRASDERDAYAYPMHALARSLGDSFAINDVATWLGTLPRRSAR